MRNAELVQRKIFSFEEIHKFVAAARVTGKTIAFTNGCFDILHEGHIYSLSQAAMQADYLIVGLNSDKSVKKLKGDNRPVNKEFSRALLLASLLMVDAVVIFEEDTPLNLISAVKPDVLVKGGEYNIEQIAGAKEVLAYGGRVIVNTMIANFSTSKLVEKIQKL